MFFLPGKGFYGFLVPGKRDFNQGSMVKMLQKNLRNNQINVCFDLDALMLKVYEKKGSGSGDLLSDLREASLILDHLVEEQELNDAYQVTFAVTKEESMQMYACQLEEKGFCVLLPSEGKRMTHISTESARLFGKEVLCFPLTMRIYPKVGFSYPSQEHVSVPFLPSRFMHLLQY